MLYLMLSIIFQKKAKYTKYELTKNINRVILLKIFTNAENFTYTHKWKQFSISKYAVQVGINTSQSPFQAQKV